MISYSPMLPEDILSLDIVNLDAKSENFTFSYYMHYFINHPADLMVATSHTYNLPKETDLLYTRPIVGYCFGKKEAKEKPCYHLSAISVSPCARNSGVGGHMMHFFENTGNAYKCWFIDLFVRESNSIAISFYKKLGYTVYRKVIDYYLSPKEHAYDMRKSLEIDTKKDMMREGKDIPSGDLI